MSRFHTLPGTFPQLQSQILLGHWEQPITIPTLRTACNDHVKQQVQQQVQQPQHTTFVLALLPLTMNPNNLLAALVDLFNTVLPTIHISHTNPPGATKQLRLQEGGTLVAEVQLPEVPKWHVTLSGDSILFRTATICSLDSRFGLQLLSSFQNDRNWKINDCAIVLYKQGTPVNVECTIGSTVANMVRLLDTVLRQRRTSNPLFDPKVVYIAPSGADTAVDTYGWPLSSYQLVDTSEFDFAIQANPKLGWTRKGKITRRPDTVGEDASSATAAGPTTTTTTTHTPSTAMCKTSTTTSGPMNTTTTQQRRAPQQLRPAVAELRERIPDNSGGGAHVQHNEGSLCSSVNPLGQQHSAVPSSSPYAIPFKLYKQHNKEVPCEGRMHHLPCAVQNGKTAVTPSNNTKTATEFPPPPGGGVYSLRDVLRPSSTPKPPPTRTPPQQQEQPQPTTTTRKAKSIYSLDFDPLVDSSPDTIRHINPHPNSTTVGNHNRTATPESSQAHTHHQKHDVQQQQAGVVGKHWQHNKQPHKANDLPHHPPPTIIGKRPRPVEAPLLPRSFTSSSPPSKRQDRESILGIPSDLELVVNTLKQPTFTSPFAPQ